MKIPRKICTMCGAHKYTKYLTKLNKKTLDGVILEIWTCRNKKLCSVRSPNYRK